MKIQPTDFTSDSYFVPSFFVVFYIYIYPYFFRRYYWSDITCFEKRHLDENKKSLSTTQQLAILKSRYFKNRELYSSNLPQNSNFWRESFVQKTGVQIPVEEGNFFLPFFFFLYLFHFVHKKLNIKT